MTQEDALKAFKEMYEEIDKENWLFIGTINPQMVEHAIKALSAQPERKAGRWELSPFDGNWTCSRCGNKPYHFAMKNMNYCPNCGAKMDLEMVEE